MKSKYAPNKIFKKRLNKQNKTSLKKKVKKKIKSKKRIKKSLKKKNISKKKIKKLSKKKNSKKTYIKKYKTKIQKIKKSLILMNDEIKLQKQNTGINFESNIIANANGVGLKLTF